jgi:hypothetical protein
MVAWVPEPPEPVSVRHLPDCGLTRTPFGCGGPGLGAGPVAVVEVDDGAVGRVAAVDVEALAEHLEGAVGLDRPVLRVRAVAGVDLDRVVIRG